MRRSRGSSSPPCRREQPVGAYYTVRRWRPDVHELDMLFVLHGIDDGADDGAGGAAARGRHGGARRPRGTVGAARRRSRRRRRRTGTCSSPTTPACQAVAAIIESLPAGTSIEVVADVDSEEDRLPLPAPAGVTVTWRYRRGAAPGTTTALARRRPGPALAGRRVRTPGAVPRAGPSPPCAATCVDERGLPQDAVSMTGYWRLGDH